MLPSSKTYAALKHIAALARSDSPVEDTVRAIIVAAKEAVGLSDLALVRRDESVRRRLSSAVIPEGISSSLRKRYEAAADRAVTTQAPVTGNDSVRAFPVGAMGALIAAGPPAKDGVDEFLQTVASQISLALERNDLHKGLRRVQRREEKRVEEVATIYEIGQAINSQELDQTLRMITEKATAVMDAQACSLLLKDPETDHLVIEASYGLAEDIAKGTRIRYGEGIAGTVAQTGEPMLILDVAKDPRFAGEHIEPRLDVVSSLCVPLKDEVGDIIGVLSIRRHVPASRFTQNDLKLFSIFASQASLAITNAQLYRRLNSRIQEMAIVSDLLRTISSTLDLDSVLNQISENILDVVGFDRCVLYLHDPRADELAASVIRGFDIGEVPEERVCYGEGVVGLAAKERIPIFAQSSPAGASGKHDPVQPRQSLAIPIVVRDTCIGVVLVDNKSSDRLIPSESVELLSMFVNQAGIAIENARLYEAMEQKYSELNVLYEQGRAIGAAYGLENAASLLVDAAIRAVQSDAGALFLFDERRHTLRAQCMTGVSGRMRRRIEKAICSADAEHIIRQLRDPIVGSPGEGLGSSKGEWAFLSDALSGYQSTMLTPLIAEDSTIGALLLGRSSPTPFGPGDIKFMSIIVSHAAAALKNAIRYEERMQEKVLELSALYEFATRISSAASLEEALDSIVAIVCGLVQCDECMIYAIDYDRNVASAKASYYRATPARSTSDEPLDSAGIVSWVIRERKALVSPNIADDPRFEPIASSIAPVMSLMSIPLMVQDEVVGVLNVHSYSPNQYSADDVRVLSIVASQSAAIYKELEALSALTSYTDSILSSIAAGVVTLDSEGLVLTWNKAAEQIVGRPAEQVVGRPYRRVINGLPVAKEDKSATNRIIETVLRTGETYQAFKLCYHNMRGDLAYLNLSASQLVNSSGERLGLVIIFEEVTREIEMEEQFRRMGELAALGQLAASIAHELRNPLSSIKGAAQYLQKEYEDHPALVEFLGIITEEVDGLNKLTTEFLEFARPIQLELEPTNINDVVEKTLQLMSLHIAENNVTVKDKLNADISEIQADQKQIEQVLRNMVLNSIQAMPSGGELTIQTKPAASGGVELWVQDTGTGVSQENLERIFLPFFTTKARGTGLGLSVVRKIVENHGGRVIVRSDAGKGCSFGVILPTAAPPRGALEGKDGKGGLLRQ